MQTTIEVPDELLERAKRRAEDQGVSFHVFVAGALEAHLCVSGKRRQDPPVVGSPGGPVIRLATREEIDDAMLG